MSDYWTGDSLSKNPLKTGLAKITRVIFARQMKTNYRLIRLSRKIFDLVGIHVVGESAIPTK